MQMKIPAGSLIVGAPFLTLLAFLGLLGRDAWAAELLYTNGLESGFGDVGFAGGCYDYSFSLVNGPAREGSTAVRVINKGNEDNSNCPGQVGQPGKHRAEIKWGESQRYSELNTPYWFGFSIFVPDDYPTSQQEGGGVIVMQLIGGAYGPELWLQIQGGETWLIRRDWSTGPGDTGNEETFETTPVERGVWTDWVIYRERAWDQSGITRIWKNGEMIVDTDVPWAINYVALGNGGNVALKTGLYWGTEPRPVDYTLLFDAVRTATGPAGYDLVSPCGDGTCDAADGGASTSEPDAGLPAADGGSSDDDAGVPGVPAGEEGEEDDAGATPTDGEPSAAADAGGAPEEGAVGESGEGEIEADDQRVGGLAESCGSTAGVSGGGTVALLLLLFVRLFARLFSSARLCRRERVSAA